MFCRKCGNEIPDDSVFCPKCGAQCTPDDSDIKEVVVTRASRGKSKKRKLILLCGLLVSIICICGVVFYFLTKEKSPEQIYREVSPATVEIQIETHRDESVTGSGFFINDAGDIVTNYHVIENAREGVAYVKDVGPFEIKSVKAYSEELDVAVISIAYKPSTFLERRKKELSTGIKVYAVGSSLGFTNSFSSGLVSSTGRTIGHNVYIQTTAPISHGNSGGPLVDGYGDVIGITSATIAEGQNINLVIPISVIDNLQYTFLEFYQFGNLTNPDQLSYDELKEQLQKDNEEFPFIGFEFEDGTKIVHADDDCSFLNKQRNDWNNGGKPPISIVRFATLEEAIADGFEPCDVCN